MVSETIEKSESIKSFIEKVGANIEVVKYICSNHMNIANFKSMNNKNKERYKQHPFFFKLVIFHKLDNMLINIEELENLYKTLEL